jgi:hypothetical protein
MADIDTLYILNVKTLEVTNIKIDYIQDNFIYFTFDEQKCSYYLKNNVQTLLRPIWSDPQYLVSKDLMSLHSIIESLRYLVRTIGFSLKTGFENIYDEKFDKYWRVK